MAVDKTTIAVPTRRNRFSGMSTAYREYAQKVMPSMAAVPANEAIQWNEETPNFATGGETTQPNTAAVENAAPAIENVGGGQMVASQPNSAALAEANGLDAAARGFAQQGAGEIGAVPTANAVGTVAGPVAQPSTDTGMNGGAVTGAGGRGAAANGGGVVNANASGNYPDMATDPYGYLAARYGKQETPADVAERERKERNQARVAGMLGLFTGIGNMLVTSSNRYGRGVKSPDFAKTVSDGLVSREKKRREEEQIAATAAAKQQEQDQKRKDMAWNRAFKAQEAKDKQTRWEAEQNAKAAANADKLKADNDNKKAERENRLSIAKIQAEEKAKNRAATNQRAAADRALRREIANSKGSGNSRVTNTATNIRINDDYEVNLPHNKWKDSPENVRKVYELAKKIDPEYFGEETKWYEDNGKTLKVNDELRQAIASYVQDHPGDDVTRELMRLNGDDPDAPQFHTQEHVFGLDSVGTTLQSDMQFRKNIRK